jgi:hypothetical protein
VVAVGNAPAADKGDGDEAWDFGGGTGFPSATVFGATIKASLKTT